MNTVNKVTNYYPAIECSMTRSRIKQRIFQFVENFNSEFSKYGIPFPDIDVLHSYQYLDDLSLDTFDFKKRFRIIKADTNNKKNAENLVYNQVDADL